MPVVLVDDLEHRFGFDTGELYVRLREIEYLETVELQRRRPQQDVYVVRGFRTSGGLI